MILFLSDWAKYPNAIADFETKNKSFLKISALFKAMGLKNHTFMLALHDKELIGVDPHNYEKLTHNQIIRIATECRVNPWYFVREVVRVPAGSGDDAIPLEANRGNIGLFWYFFNHVTVFLIQIRQTGKSLNSDILDCYLLNIRCTGTTINLMTKDDALRSINIQRIKDIFSALPWYLNQRSKKDLDNTEVINVGSLGNWYRTALPQKSPKMALNVGRGSTAAIYKNDEAPFQPNCHISIPAALAAGGNARDRARKNNEPYGTVFTTTAGQKDEVSGKFVFQELSCAAVHTEHFYDCADQVELEKVIRQASRTNTRLYKKDDTSIGEYAVNITLNHAQLGKTDEWLMRTIQESKASGDDANRDFFNRWTSGTLRSPFSPTQADRIRSSEIEPLYVDINQKTGYTVRWFVPKDRIDEVMRNNKTVVSVDTSDAAGADDIGIRVILDKTGQTLASFNINVTNLLVFSDWFAHEWIVKYENTTSIIERRSSGVSLIDHLLIILPSYGIDPFKRLFNRVVNEKEQYQTEWDEIQLPLSRRSEDIYVRLKKHFGFATSAYGITSRSELYGTTLSSAVSMVGNVIYDKVTIDQILGLVKKNGRIDHGQGEHDDMVIGWLLGHWFLTQGKNLYFYGFNVVDIFSNIKVMDDLTDEGRYESNLQRILKSNIQKALESLANENDVFIIERKEHEIRMLQSQLKEDENDLYSIDELLKKAKDIRKERFLNKGNKPYNYDDIYSRAREISVTDNFSTYRSSFLR